MYRQRGAGTPLFKRKIEGVGLIRRAYGSNDPGTIQAIRVMVDQLVERGEVGALKGVAAGQITLFQIYQQWKKENVKGVQTVQDVQDFETTALGWLDGYDGVGHKARENYRERFNTLLKVKSKFTVADLPAVMKDYRVKCYKRGTGRVFNMTRTAVRSFLRDTYNQYHPLYLAIAAIRPLTEDVKRKERAWSIPEVTAVTNKLIELGQPKVAASFWTMCLTGVGYDEYAKGITKEGGGLRIVGTKMRRKDDRRNRIVPLIEEPAPLTLGEKRFRGWIKKASDGKMLPYDGRRIYSRLLGEAGVRFEHIQVYMGHSPRTMTDRYSRSDMTEFLQADAERVRAFLLKKKTVRVNPIAALFLEDT